MWQKLDFLDHLGLQKKSLLSVDIGAYAIKILELNKTRSGRYRIEHLDFITLPPYSLKEKLIKNQENIIKGLTELLSRNKLRTDWVICSVSGTSAIVRIIHMSNGLTDQDIFDEIELDADKYIPYPLSEVNIDYASLGPNAIHPNNTQDVLLAAARKDQIQMRLDIFAAANLKPKIIEIDSFAYMRGFKLLVNQLPHNAIKQTVALVDIGADTMSLNVFEDFRHIYFRESFFGGLQLTEEIERRYGLSYVEAENAKINGGLPDDYFIEVLDPYKTTIIQYIGRLLQFFFSSEKGIDIEYIALTGGGSQLPGLDFSIQEKLGYKTFLPNPLLEFELNKNLDAALVTQVAPQFMLTAGLALRNLENHR